MPINKPDYQLTFQLDLPDVDGQVADGQVIDLPLRAEEIRLRSETAREALNGGGFKWLDEYNHLRDGGWDWRVAAYIAWASSPRSSRSPKTQEELARNHLGLTSDRAIATWRKKNPAIDEMVAVLQASPLWDYRAEVFQALTANAVKPDYKTHNDRKLFLEITGDYMPSAKLIAMLSKGSVNKADLAKYSDAELASMYRSLVDDMETGKQVDTETGRQVDTETGEAE